MAPEGCCFEETLSPSTQISHRALQDSGETTGRGSVIVIPLAHLTATVLPYVLSTKTGSHGADKVVAVHACMVHDRRESTVFREMVV